MIATGTGSDRVVAGFGRVLNGPTGRLAVALIAAAVGLVSLRTAQASLGFSYLSESPIYSAVGLVAGWGFVTMGLESWHRGRRRRFGKLLAIAGIAWFLPEWSDPAIGAPGAFTLGLVLSWLYPAVVTHAIFEVAGNRRSWRLDRVFVASGYIIAVVGLGLIPTLGFDPQALGCGLCPVNLIEIRSSPTFVDDATRISAMLMAALSVTIALVLTTRVIRSGPIGRPISASVVLPGVIFLSLVAASTARATVEVIAPTDTADHLLRFAQGISLGALALGVTVEWIWVERSRRRLARVVADLAESPVGGLRDHLATILMDPDLILSYPIEGGRSVDAHGRSANDLGPYAGRRKTTPVIRDGKVVALIDHDMDVLRGPGEIEEVVTVARLGLEHERLQAEARAQLEDLRQARRRIVEDGDARRRQLERDLHDGAQQHLIALSISLRFIEPHPAIVACINEAANELKLALADLREVARGIYPTVLSDEGFAAAVDALAEASLVPLTITDLVDERFDPAIEVAAYHVIADVVRRGAGPLVAGARQHGGRLTVEVTASQIPAWVLEEIADRVAAADGSIAVARLGQAIRLTAELPCAS